jgi:glycerate kinase
MHTTSYGTGELIVDAIRRGCRHILLGIGGSATNDAGIGMLQALGFQFLDKDGKEVEKGGKCLQQIAAVRMDSVLPELKSCRFQLAVDVDTPFCGPEGAVMTFAPQKGATATNLEVLEKGMQHLASFFNFVGKEITMIPGSGAGGGIAGGCLAFLNAELIPGIEMVKQFLRFDELIKDADLIITGEGKMDQQTLRGKTPFGVLQSAKRQNIPVIAITGQLLLSREEWQSAGFDAVYAINPPDMSLSEAMKPGKTFFHIFDTVRKIFS